MRPKVVTGRMEFRVQPQLEQEIRLAASLRQVPVSDFIRSAVEERASEVVRQTRPTIVPAAFFDELVAALDGPVEVNESLARAIDRARGLVERR